MLPGCARGQAAHSRQRPEKLSLSVKPSLGVSCRMLCSQHRPLAAGTRSSQPSPGRHQPPHRNGVGLGEALHGSGVDESMVGCRLCWDVPKLAEPRAQSLRLLSPSSVLCCESGGDPSTGLAVCEDYRGFCRAAGSPGRLGERSSCLDPAWFLCRVSAAGRECPHRPRGFQRCPKMSDGLRSSFSRQMHQP